MASVVLCGVPHVHCTGGKIATNQGTRSHVVKAHRSHSEAFKCYARYLVKILEYEQVEARVFRPPPGVNGGYLRVLTKKSRFGERFRPGKEGRFMPDFEGGGAIIHT